MTTQPPVTTDNTNENPDSLEPQIDLGDSTYYCNRHISLLEFNLRVLAQAEDVELPLMERLKFLLIFSSNMDEFFEVRLAGLQRDIAFNQARPESDGMHPKDVLKLISDMCHAAIERQYRLLNDDLLPLLAQENIHFIARDSWSAAQVKWIKHYFRQQVAPVLTPIGLDLAHPFPRLVNKSLNFLVTLEGNDAFGRKLGMAVVPAPKSLPRIIRMHDDVCESGDNFIFLSSIIHYHAGYLFPGMKSTGCYQFRLTRNSDLFLDEEKVEDLSTALRGELYSRRYGEEVRLEVADNMPDELIEFLLNKFGLDDTQLYKVNGPVNLTRMMSVLDAARTHHEFPSFKPKLPGDLQRSDRMFAAITSGDILLNHPYESFQPVIYFLKQAARDPDVVAIKQTLYRTGTNSDILDLLVEAARNGKEVTAVVELRARFDEESNLEIAARLQEAGVVVVYGIVGHKTHAKMMLVVRREGAKLKRYVHLGTGNYHAGNARLYSDYSLLTCNEELAEDTHKIFQELTGMGRPAQLRHLYHSPFTLQQELLIQHIKQERDNALNGLPAKIIFKCNSLTDKTVIEELYRASQAGVEVKLIVRGMCCLRPGIPGVSENIEVRSIVGRFLEHTRVYYFHQNGEYSIYLASADLMERNLYRRVEISFPILDDKLRARTYKQGLEIYLKDNCQAWTMNTDGSYTRIQPQEGEERISAQNYLVEKLG